MIVTGSDEETLVSYAAVFIDPLLRQVTQVSYKTPICANGTGSPKIGDLVIEPDAKFGKVKEVEDTSEGPRVIAVYKPGQKPSYRNEPSFPFKRSLREQVDHHVEAQGKYREKAEELGVQDIRYNQLPSSENAAYVEYNTEINPGEFGFAAVSADEEGVYFSRATEPREIDGTKPNKTQLGRMQDRVLRYLIETTFNEELAKAEYDQMIKTIGAACRKNILSAVRNNISGRYFEDSNIRQEVKSYVTQEDDVITFESELVMLTGNRYRGSRHDARLASDVLTDLNRISFDVDNGLFLKRKTYPVVRTVLGRSEAARLAYSHIVGAVYVLEFSLELLPTLYENNRNLMS